MTNNTAPAQSLESTESERTSELQVAILGSPTGLQVTRHESGELLASWNAPDSGHAPTGYTVQWKESGDDWADRNEVSEAVVTGTSHIVAGLTDGTEYAVRVIANGDGANSDPSGEVAATPAETTPPELSSAAVDGVALTLTFDEALDTGDAADRSAFTVTVAGSGRGVDTVAVSGSAVTLTLVTAVAAGDAVTVDYTTPTDESAARLQDMAGNAAASFSGQSVTNDTQEADPLTASVSGVPASHDGSASFTFELRFSEEPADGFSYKTLRDNAFTVTGGEVVKVRRLEKGKNLRWEIHVAPDGDGAVTARLPVTTDCAATGAVCTGDGRMLSRQVGLEVPGARESDARTPVTAPVQVQGQELPPLTASVSEEPASHDGSASFTFELRFSETPRKGFSYSILQDHALTVTAGEVTKVRRLEKGKNVRWEIHVTPYGDGTVTIVLPATTDCTAEGAICTQDLRPLSDRVEITVPGPGG